MSSRLVKAVVQETKKKIKLREPVIAVDFDGTIAKDFYPGVGPAMPGVKEALSILPKSLQKISAILKQSWVKAKLSFLTKST